MFLDVSGEFFPEINQSIHSNLPDTLWQTKMTTENHHFSKVKSTF
jgi:hypothetical protein